MVKVDDGNSGIDWEVRLVLQFVSKCLTVSAWILEPDCCGFESWL